MRLQIVESGGQVRRVQRSNQPAVQFRKNLGLSPIRATVDVTVEPLTDTSSRLTTTVDFDEQGIGKLLVPLIVRRHERNASEVDRRADN